MAPRPRRPNTVPWQVRIDADLVARAKKLAHDRVISPSLVVEAALRNLLDEHADESDRIDAEILRDRLPSSPD